MRPLATGRANGAARGRRARNRADGNIALVRPGQTNASPPIGYRAVMLAAVLVVLFGILGMHAINNHGVMGSGPSGSGHDMSSMAATPVSAATVVVSAGEQAAGLVAPAISDPADSGHEPGGLLMLCLAMLAVASIALAAAVRSSNPLRWLTHPRRADYSRSPLRSPVRGTGPPPSWEFSVIRC